ncbi:hypothetical protein [Capillimicrobium parvum]|uniref:Uncharacterized protein n=1 Tax=Capillimicrobium parvum TaxID=2884022 RepID=A0A9E6XWW4_9ACTN|nr:hypothetical protein [Capillimicrobium parvum]UGS35635.1 hypothetical protein DSM104329_02030 [Capillimicrobium parvum]
MPYPNVVLEALGVESYGELMDMDTQSVVRKIDAAGPGGVPLHQGDMTLAVLVLSAVADLEEATKRLDRARTRFERLGFALLIISTLATVVAAVATIAAL